MQRADTERDEIAQRDQDATTSHEDASSERAPTTYEPPRLVRVGSLRDLLGKSGTIPDKGPPFELHN